MKNYFLLSFLVLVGFGLFPFAFADTFRGLDYSLTTNPDGSYTRVLGLPPYIESNGIFQPFIFTDHQNHLIVETNHGSVKLHKESCAFEYYPNGIINVPVLDANGNIISYNHRQILFNDSIVPLMADLGSDDFSIINSINNASCVPSWNGSELTATKQSQAGKMEYKYILNNGKWKTQLEATNLSSVTDKAFAFTQTIDLNRDVITFGNQQRNLDNFDGKSFDRTFLVNNESKVINFLNGFYFDFDLAFDKLNQVNIFDTGINKSKLSFDYTFNPSLVLPGETLIIDPTFGEHGSTYEARFFENSGATGVSCNDSSFAYQTNIVQSFFARASTDTTNPICVYGVLGFDLSSIPTNADITNTVLTTDYTQYSGHTRGCDYIEVDFNPLTVSAQVGYETLRDETTEYVSSSTTCQGNSNDNNHDLGSTADTNAESAIGGWFYVATRFDDYTRGALNDRSDITNHALTLTYNIPPDPPRQVFAGQNLDLTWLAGETNGDSHISYEVEYYDDGSASWIELVSQSGVDYNSSDPINDESLKVRIYDTGALGRGCPQFAMNSTLSSSLVGHWHLCYTMNDSGLEDNDGTATGNELYVIDGSKIYWDGDSSGHIEIPNESDYDFEYTDDFSMFLELDGFDGTNTYVLMKKGLSINNPGYGIQTTASGQFRVQIINNNGSGDEIDETATGVIYPGAYHLGFTYDGSATPSADDLKLYVNGVEVTTAVNTDGLTGSILNNEFLTIAGDNAGTYDNPHQIRNAMIFNATLSSNEVAQLYGEYIYHNAEPDASSLSAIEIADSGLRFSSIAGDPGSQTVTNYSIRCDTNGGGWVTQINSDSIVDPRVWELTGLSTEDVVICQWRDESSAGVGLWSNNATDSIIIDIIQGARSDTADKLKEFENFLNEAGGVYFGLSLFPLVIMLFGFMAGKKTVRIFTLLTLMAMGIVHASGYFVYPDWYWTLSLLLGLGLVLGRQRSD